MKKILLFSLLAVLAFSMDYQEYLKIYGDHHGYSEIYFLKNIAQIQLNNRGNSGFFMNIN